MKRSILACLAGLLTWIVVVTLINRVLRLSLPNYTAAEQTLQFTLGMKWARLLMMKAELYILGVLHRGNFHPYEIKRRLTVAMIECFTDVDVGTLYYAVRQLAKCGLLTAVAHERVARGGMRTVYRITPRGRDRFRELLHAQFAAEGDLRETLYGPMLFLHLADLNLVAKALRTQIDRQNGRRSEIQKLHRQWATMLPTGSRHLMQHMAEQCRLDLRWLRTVLADVEAGRIRETPDPARLAAKT